ncbi:hypothetical protein OPAG_03949 [Rhodococcus opacus PD630]|nr:hypothetical protein Pd630_LPD03627 [Rhodococcus opacus PD630]EHI47141.1 hypothetical protein OPAG_03949 [Rhodococcus opacus PD630]
MTAIAEVNDALMIIVGTSCGGVMSGNCESDRCLGIAMPRGGVHLWRAMMRAWATPRTD